MELEEIWENQKKFNSNFVDYDNLDKEEAVNQTKEYILHLNSECDEFLREMAWKIHRKQNGEIIKSNLKEEWIDIFKFWLSLGILWGFTPEDFINEYQRKSEVVEQRYKQEKQLEFHPDRIVGVDIDGVLADYPQYFLDYINKKVGTNYQASDLDDYNIYEMLDLPENLTKELKHEFRSSGKLKNVPVCKGAKSFLKRLKQTGYQIVLLSARPYKKYKRIFADTQEWLNKNQLIHDAILWDENKCDRLIKEFGSRKVEFFIEDCLENANNVAKTTKVYLLNKSYNQGETKNGVIRINNLKEVLKNERVE